MSGTEEERWMQDADWVRTSPFLMPCEVDFDLARTTSPDTLYSGHRVGYYFESLVEAMLRSSTGIEMLACGQQVIEEGRTIGELDFVFRNNNDQVHHWEVAAKFYLYCVDHQVFGSHFIGPNAGDTFERKRRKIIDQQLPLSRSAFPNVTRRNAFVKGRIFYHPLQELPAELPEGLLPDHLHSTWIRASELALLESLSADAYCVLQKPYWLAPEFFPKKHPTLLSPVELADLLGKHFAEKSHPLLLAALTKQKDEWHETDRIFVVSDQWPD